MACMELRNNNMKRKALTAVGVSLFAFTIALVVMTSASRAPTDAVPRAVVNPASIDFGDIDQKGGLVATTVTVLNSGNTPLEIHRVSTSCGCTTANMDTSPLQPDEERALTISFDPMVHADQSGPITRVVYLQTSDPEQPEIEINIIGNVIPSE